MLLKFNESFCNINNSKITIFELKCNYKFERVPTKISYVVKFKFIPKPQSEHIQTLLQINIVIIMF